MIRGLPTAPSGPTADAVTVRAPAKINLSLTVAPPGDDGYHPIATVFHAIALYDHLSADPAPDGEISLELVGDGADVAGLDGVPTDETNLAVRAARLLAEHTGVTEGARLWLRKAIPVAGGLAGGSADAAAALVACNALWGTRVPAPEMHELAARLGSDVPFSLLGGTAVGTGRGEQLAPVPVRDTFHWVLAVDDAGLSTPAVYAELDRQRAEMVADRVSVVSHLEVPDDLIRGLREGDVATLGRAMANDLQPAAVGLRPGLFEVLRLRVTVMGAGAVVSGSGPTCVFLAHGEAHARTMGRALTAAGCRVLHATGPVPGARVVPR